MIDLPIWQNICEYLTIYDIKNVAHTCRYLSLLGNTSVLRSKPIDHYIKLDLPQICEFYPIDVQTNFNILFDQVFYLKAPKFCLLLYRVNSSLFKSNLYPKLTPNLDKWEVEKRLKKLKIVDQIKSIYLMEKIFYLHEKSLLEFETHSNLYNGAFNLSGLLPVIPSPRGLYQANEISQQGIGTKIYNAVCNMFKW